MITGTVVLQSFVFGLRLGLQQFLLLITYISLTNTFTLSLSLKQGITHPFCQVIEPRSQGNITRCDTLKEDHPEKTNPKRY